ncbi:type II secretion system minor pseudopilin GspI [Thiorhodospira sibirica]|uniref:type II secretion system minor pseudopilin GspI n=1 Tax=Thiorhodospira sibirica TaxID=154347 RepID=UPI00022C04B6|nr:type II secretion system minor pseudopilin GspI [Thiorhodospira sibirica]
MRPVSLTQRGFTLLEVLVAITVLALALGSLIKAGSQNALNAAYLRDRSYAHWVALNEVNRYRIGARSITEGHERGSAEMAGREWYWQATIQRHEQILSENLSVEAWRIEINVRDRNEVEQTPLATLIAYQPLP